MIIHKDRTQGHRPDTTGDSFSFTDDEGDGKEPKLNYADLTGENIIYQMRQRVGDKVIQRLTP